MLRLHRKDLEDLYSAHLTPPPLPEGSSDKYSFPQFIPQRMVNWFSPLELARTGGRVVLASIFGSYADKREVQAALHQSTEIDTRYLKQDELWFDYIADIGDGFDSTYTMAYLLSEAELNVRGTTAPLKRGQILLLGGDQVYPTASRNAYRSRMIGPYSLANPELKSAHRATTTESAKADLYAIPGNHDWYDGLTSFVRTFCQDRTLGAWQTRQRRSYYCIALPHNWWIWGIDIQLEADIDNPQLQYFVALATKMKERAINSKPKLLIVTAEPAWVYAGANGGPRMIERDEEAFDNLEFFLQHTVWPNDIDLQLLIAGDLHHYARYSRNDMTGVSGPVHLVTAGGGGAYLSATHHLCESIDVSACVESAKKRGIQRPYQLGPTYPSRAESFRRSFGCFLLPIWSWTFAVSVGLTYLLFAWQLQAGSRADCRVTQWPSDASKYLAQCWETPLQIDQTTIVRHLSLMDVLIEGYPLVTALWWEARALMEVPSLFVTVGIFWLLLFAFCSARGWTRAASTTVHVTAHIVATAAAVWLGARVVVWLGDTVGWYDPAGPYYGGGGRTIVFGVCVFGIGASMGTLLFAAYLWLSAHLVNGAPHMNEVFAARRYKDYKHFLRFHLQPGGDIRVVVVGVKRVARLWRLRREADTQYSSAKAFYDPVFPPQTEVADTFSLGRAS